MKKILVVVDAQNDFVDGALGSREAQAAIPNICEKIRNFNEGLIILTQDTHESNYLETKEGRALPVEHCIEFTEGWMINIDVAGVAVRKNAVGLKTEVVFITKPTFGSEDLLCHIEDYVGGEEFDITFVGFCTDICVLSNAIMTKARFFEQANIFVDASCSAGVTPQKHLAALEVMRSCQITIENE